MVTLAFGEAGKVLDGNLVAFAVVLVVLVVPRICRAGGYGFRPFVFHQIVGAGGYHF